MTTSIHTLIPDIQAILKRKDGWMTPYKDELGKAVADRLEAQFAEPQTPRLRMSKLGPMCPKALWHSVHTPELEEPLPPWAETKFSLGHIVEAYAVTLCKAAGHRVEGEQDVLELDGVRGHRDAIVDGCTVDFKSCSSRQFQKFKSGLIEEDDPFGYLDQLDGYVVSGLQDVRVVDKHHGYIVAFHKELGHIALYEHRVRPERIRQRIAECKRVVEASKPPACTCGTTIHGASGNIKLDTKASYSSFKFTCFPDLRGFVYSDGPVYLTKVVRRPKPDVLEIDRYGQVVH